MVKHLLLLRRNNTKKPHWNHPLLGTVQALHLVYKTVNQAHLVCLGSGLNWSWLILRQAELSQQMCWPLPFWLPLDDSMPLIAQALSSNGLLTDQKEKCFPFSVYLWLLIFSLLFSWCLYSLFLWGNSCLVYKSDFLYFYLNLLDLLFFCSTRLFFAFFFFSAQIYF